MAKTESPAEPLIRNVSDTARWVAVYRAQESERRDAHFHDPFARRLAGERGEQIAKSMPLATDSAWSMITRTYLIDALVRAETGRGADMVINSAAALDSRRFGYRAVGGGVSRTGKRASRRAFSRSFC